MTNPLASYICAAVDLLAARAIGPAVFQTLARSRRAAAAYGFCRRLEPSASPLNE